MRLLMTRPEPDASLSAERLRALGHDVLVDPVMNVTFSQEPLRLNGSHHLVVTSRNGVRALNDIATQVMREETVLFTVGDATAKLAREAGFRDVRSAAGTISQLVDLLGMHETKEQYSLIYVCGRDRKGQLEDKLRAQGWQVDVCERYHANFVECFSPETLNAFRQQMFDGILLYSNRTAEAFKELIHRYELSQSTNSIAFFGLAKSIQSVFDRGEGIQLIVAEHPNEQSLFDAIELYQRDGKELSDGRQDLSS